MRALTKHQRLKRERDSSGNSARKVVKWESRMLVNPDRKNDNVCARGSRDPNPNPEEGMMEIVTLKDHDEENVQYFLETDMLAQ
eukprot:300422-Amphidinium_carterae.1